MATLALAMCVRPERTAEIHRHLTSNPTTARLFTVVCPGNVPEDFATFKKDCIENRRDIVMLVEGPLSHDVIKFLCDDVNEQKRRVKFIYSVSVGVDMYRLNELQQELRGIPFTNGKGAYSSILAEHVIFSMLYFNRQAWRLQQSRAARSWDVFNMVELRGQTVGIVGYGDIGRACARLAIGMGMSVIGVRRSEPSEPVDDLGATVLHGEDGIDRAVREADFVVNVMPGVPSRHRYFDKTVFAKMKPSAVYINIGRGMTQNEDDLHEALQTGVIAGAALDVFETEPLPQSSPLWQLGDDKLLLTAHNACRSSFSISAVTGRFRQLAEQFLQTGSVAEHVADLSEI